MRPAPAPAVGAGGAALLGVPAGPTEISWLSPRSLGSLLLIRVYLRKKDPCQDPHAGGAGPGYAWHKTLFAGGEMPVGPPKTSEVSRGSGVGLEARTWWGRAAQ